MVLKIIKSLKSSTKLFKKAEKTPEVEKEPVIKKVVTEDLSQKEVNENGKVDYHGFKISKDLVTLIKHSIKDGKITRSERIAISNKAKREGISKADIVILVRSLAQDAKLRLKDRRWFKRIIILFSPILIPAAIFIVGIIIYSVYSVIDKINEKTELFTYRGSNDAKNVINAITDYDFEMARKHLANIQSAVGDDSSVEYILQEKYRKLSLQLYSAEIDYYLNDKSYELAFQTTNDLYQLLNNYSFDYDAIDNYYLPVMSRLIVSLLDDDKIDEATKYAKSVSDDGVKTHLLSEINLKVKQ